MDTTIRNLDAEAYRRIKARAALEGRTLGEAVSEAIRRYVEQQSPAASGARTPRSPSHLAGELAEGADQRGGYGEAVAAGDGDTSVADPHAPPAPTSPLTLAACLKRLAKLGRPDADYLDELEAIQAAQPRLGPDAWDS